ncbi:hypothetical protein JCM10213_006054 [Rhodosporidiobolus nylandii]
MSSSKRKSPPPPSPASASGLNKRQGLAAHSPGTASTSATGARKASVDSLVAGSPLSSSESLTSSLRSAEPALSRLPSVPHLNAMDTSSPPTASSPTLAEYLSLFRKGSPPTFLRLSRPLANAQDLLSALRATPPKPHEPLAWPIDHSCDAHELFFTAPDESEVEDEHKHLSLAYYEGNETYDLVSNMPSALEAMCGAAVEDEFSFRVECLAREKGSEHFVQACGGGGASSFLFSECGRTHVISAGLRIGEEVKEPSQFFSYDETVLQPVVVVETALAQSSGNASDEVAAQWVKLESVRGIILLNIDLEGNVMHDPNFSLKSATLSFYSVARPPNRDPSAVLQYQQPLFEAGVPLKLQSFGTYTIPREWYSKVAVEKPLEYDRTVFRGIAITIQRGVHAQRERNLVLGLVG